uniref:C2H2-type domain-containing protein n=1 Tax=Latimeria chalumnae TaxID=7897 RepID=H3B562_LATCH
MSKTVLIDEEIQYCIKCASTAFGHLRHHIFNEKDLTIYICQMQDSRLPKQLFFSQLSTGQRCAGGQRKRYKDILKANMKKCGINTDAWEELASDRTKWKAICNQGIKMPQTEGASRRSPPPDSNYTCDICGCICRSRIGLLSHLRIHHRR